MARYIERNKVIELFKKYQPTLAINVCEFGDELEKLPTEDVTPIVRGKWIFREITETIEKGVMECKCSVCGFGENTFNGGLIPFFLRDCNYCPNCGAKMKESGEE